jgi:hypothetical protein
MLMTTVAGSQQAELETVKNNFDKEIVGWSKFRCRIDAVIENMGDLIKVNTEHSVFYYGALQRRVYITIFYK